MKISIYFDVYPYSRPGDGTLCFFEKPYSPKSKGAKRYLVCVDIPDPAEPDYELQQEAIEVEKGGDVE